MVYPRVETAMLMAGFSSLGKGTSSILRAVSRAKRRSHFDVLFFHEELDRDERSRGISKQ